MTIKKTRNEIYAEKIGQAVAKNMFESMLDITNQGDNFTWDRFSEIFSSTVKTQVFMGFKDGVKNIEGLKTIAVDSFVEEVDKLKTEYQQNDTLPVKKVNSNKMK